MNRRTGLGLVVLLVCLAGVVAPSAAIPPDTASGLRQTPQPSAAPAHVALWPGGAPGFESRKDEPELARDYWVRNIHNPSLTVYLPPREKATGTGVVIFPGGGHRLLVFKAEGDEPARFLNGLGVAAFVLKYRLGREENSPYKLEQHPREDASRALRIVRSRAREWGVDPQRLGVMGFSAGGEVAALVAYGPGDQDAAANDPIDRLNARPNFQILVYPGPLFIPGTVPADAPAAFLVAANDDPCCAVPALDVLMRYRAAGAPVEAHILSGGKHGFNMGARSTLRAVNTWPQRLADWLADRGLLEPSTGK
jgi:acetyl esterase/lipase